MQDSEDDRYKTPPRKKHPEFDLTPDNMETQAYDLDGMLFGGIGNNVSQICVHACVHMRKVSGCSCSLGAAALGCNCGRHGDGGPLHDGNPRPTASISFNPLLVWFLQEVILCVRPLSYTLSTRTAYFNFLQKWGPITLPLYLPVTDLAGKPGNRPGQHDQRTSD